MDGRTIADTQDGILLRIRLLRQRIHAATTTPGTVTLEEAEALSQEIHALASAVRTLIQDQP